MFVFRNYTIENLFPEGTRFSGYDDISDIPSDETHLVWFFQVPVGFDTDARVRAVDSITDRLRLVIDRMDGRQTLTVCSMMDMTGVVVSDADDRLALAISRFNAVARAVAKDNACVSYLDVSEYFARYPRESWINWRFYFISQMIVAPAVAAGFSEWFTHRMSQISGARKKCLVLDLDNTLWGGVLGEDGIDGIKIGGDYPGNAFLYFQEALISLARSGVILAVCSKNNESDVLELWDKNPFVKLDRKYISAWRINWNNKADNIAELASELNIGLDSMVFVDDSPTERELVRQRLPRVAVPDFPARPYGLMTFYHELVDRYFRTNRLTDEDLKKTEQYKANAQRAAASHRFSNLTDFVRSLEINITLQKADKFNIPRIAQMTQKTNQFNLTTRRYDESDIASFVGRGSDVYCISVCDRFGDNGITGTMIVNRHGKEAEIDTFLLSCRILGKGIEDVFFRTVMNRLRTDGVTRVWASYLPTAKNSQVADFYDRQGMTLVEENEGARRYSLMLDRVLPVPDYYTINSI